MEENDAMTTEVENIYQNDRLFPLEFTSTKIDYTHGLLIYPKVIKYKHISIYSSDKDKEDIFRWSSFHYMSRYRNIVVFFCFLLGVI